MQDDAKEPEDQPKEETQPGAAEESAEKEAEKRPRKHKRKGELRKLHDRSFLKEGKGHGARVHRRKAV